MPSTNPGGQRVTCAGCSSTAELPLPSSWYVARTELLGERSLCPRCAMKFCVQRIVTGTVGLVDAPEPS